METLKNKTIIYDNACPLCDVYTGAFVKSGALDKEGRKAFNEVSAQTLQQLDLNRARHEIPLIDNQTGQVLYGLQGLLLIAGNLFPFAKPLLARPWFTKMLQPLYRFISYNRRVIAGSFYGGVGFDCAPDFNLKWRLVLIAAGIGYTGAGIYAFSLIAGVPNVLMMFVVVFLYFLLLVGTNLIYNKTFEEKVDYIGHLATLGVVESSLFVATALLARLTNLPELLFAGQGAGRLLATWLHAKRVQNNYYSYKLNYAFAIGAVALIVYLAIILH
jgi:predicted DCC family thiol-disulfide oxidoreductase YuxK